MGSRWTIKWGPNGYENVKNWGHSHGSSTTFKYGSFTPPPRVYYYSNTTIPVGLLGRDRPARTIKVGYLSCICVRIQAYIVMCPAVAVYTNKNNGIRSIWLTMIHEVYTVFLYIYLTTKVHVWQHMGHTQKILRHIFMMHPLPMYCLCVSVAGFICSRV